MPALSNPNDLAEDRLIELMMSKGMYHNPTYLMLTEDSLIMLGWTKEEITELRELERVCLS